MMEDMIFTAPSSSSSPCLKMQNFATREWRRKMERKWRDKEDEMDEGILGKWKGNGETKKMEWVKECVLRVRGEVYL
ncbi:hypothetical protein RchiOBHm_Chr2g0152041 [Rosa chinensis]|uniref:Uncharacterized protein n=1 Tax=Rosa chinensis TaxID=74649 RepID=A0A2P6S0C4_ROSCH|nr:hypothetical protein RchiOBHm_Chr2g0152041 [Rosa chinensis]